MSDTTPGATALPFTGDPEADELIARDPLALLIGFLLDQQVTVQKAFGARSSSAAASGPSTPRQSPRWIPTPFVPPSANVRRSTASPATCPSGCATCAP